MSAHASAIYEREIYLEKPLPSAPEAERSILGAILLDNTVMAQATEMLSPDDFYSPLHRRVYRAMLTLFERDEKIDPILISEELKKEGSFEAIRGVAVITNLTYGLPHFSNIGHYAQILLDKKKLRDLLRACGEISSRVLAEEEPVEEITNFAESVIFDVCDAPQISRPESAQVLAYDSIERAKHIAELRRASMDVATGIKTAIRDIDQITGGWKKTDLIIIAARPSIGKSALVSRMAFNAADSETIVAYFSPEMSKEQVIDRMICSEAKVDLFRYQNGFLTRGEWEKVGEGYDKLRDKKLYIDDTPSISAMEILAKSRRIYAENKRLDLICVDYLQEMRSSRRAESETAETTAIAKELKAVAKTMKVPVIAISSLSRECEKRNPPIPRMSDLRQSGQIEFSADVVAFLYREDYYHPTEENAGVAELIFAKHRNGPTGRVKMAFMKEFALFENYFGD